MNGVKVARKRVEGLEPEMAATDAALIALTQRLAAVDALLPMAASCADEDETYVHQLRVASRRADAALRVFKPFLCAKALKRARKALKKIRRAAGEARRCDVHIRMLRELAPRTTAALSLIPAVEAERREAQHDVRAAAEKYHGRKFAKLQAALIDSVEPMPADDEQALTLAELANRRLRRLGRQVRRLLDEVRASDASINRLHALRIRAKRLRYAMELFAPCFADGLKPACHRIVMLQDALGAINDCDDLAARLGDTRLAGFEKQISNGRIEQGPGARAAIDELRQSLLRDRDQQVTAFVNQVRCGEWDAVVRPLAEVSG